MGMGGIVGAAGSAAGGAAGGAVGAAAIARSVKASGAIVQVDAESFVEILIRHEAPVVIVAKGGFLSKQFRYLTSYRGFVFFAKSSERIDLPADIEVVDAKKIWVPD